MQITINDASETKIIGGETPPTATDNSTHNTTTTQVTTTRSTQKTKSAAETAATGKGGE